MMRNLKLLIKSNRRLAEIEREYKSNTKFIVNYSISSFTGLLNALLGNNSKNIGELKKYGEIDK